jgi:hypothetical protein
MTACGLELKILLSKSELLLDVVADRRVAPGMHLVIALPMKKRCPQLPASALENIVSRSPSSENPPEQKEGAENGRPAGFLA